MKPISKSEKEYVIKHCSNPVFHRTVNHTIVEMSADVIKALENYNKLNIKTRSE